MTGAVDCEEMVGKGCCNCEPPPSSGVGGCGVNAPFLGVNFGKGAIWLCIGSASI